VKLSRFDFLKQGENNRETYATCCSRSLNVPQHFSGSDGCECGGGRRQHQLWWKFDVQTLTPNSFTKNEHYWHSDCRKQQIAV
jgi:putative alpha-1,2-mannosidase